LIDEIKTKVAVQEENKLGTLSIFEQI